ncbi:hypothetical protein ATANTOWER_002430 [Ataeniobius toweri]|uniref:Uncharacterized protein n=1 Tax=Ataeniobius toweri TaxID=208326 RepID=A0ABU7C917_9TELE|nr:hypothetical protein [Ataeniobius toweri]
MNPPGLQAQRQDIEQDNVKTYFSGCFLAGVQGVGDSSPRKRSHPEQEQGWMGDLLSSVKRKIRESCL